MDTGVLIAIVAVVAVAAIVALVVVATSGRKKKRRTQAEHIRAEVHTETAKLEKRQALADETDARARAAEAEAEAKAAEAARLRERAAAHSDAVASSREELDERRKRADQLDPDVKSRKRGRNDELDDEAVRAREAKVAEGDAYWPADPNPAPQPDIERSEFQSR